MDEKDCRPVYLWTSDSCLVRTTRCGSVEAAQEVEKEA